MSMKRYLSFALALCLLMTVIAPASVCIRANASITENVMYELFDGNLLDLNLKGEGIGSNLKVEKIEDDEIVKIFIVMDGLSVVETDGKATFDAETQEWMDAIVAEQKQVIDSIEEDVLQGETLPISYSYTWLLNGVATQIPYELLDDIQKVDGVKQVLLQPRYEVCASNVTSMSDAQLHTISDGSMIGRESAWAQGYTGQGIKIAVIDTGLDEDHQNFQPLPDDKLTETSADESTISAVLDQLKASGRLPGLTTAELYRSTKVVFGFNYADNNLDITHDNDTMGDHGTHVAGIAAANKVDGSAVVGVAPDAQLYVMKVYGADHGGYAEDILAALEDALMLGADVINMSLGTNAGFTTCSEEVDAIYDRVALTNSVLSISAGNSYTSGYGNLWGTNANQTKYPDNAVIGEPGIYKNALSIASVENCAIQRNYISAADRKLAFIETSVSYGLPSVLELEGEYPVVLIPNYGAAEDFEGLDLTGKIAVVQRGVESFVTKCHNAALNGAVACIVYNNTSGEFGMDLTDYTSDTTIPLIPCISITMEDGEFLAASSEADEAFTISFPKETAALPSLTAYEMSEFSSWGVAPDLSLEPDITAPGGNIYSTINDGQYGLMSGTSMAAPNLSGLAALVMQYLRANYPDEDISTRELVQNLLVSTSVPLVYDKETGLPYSPRQQGSGLANSFNAICAQVYLQVEGMDSPKAELGHDPLKQGKYDFTFDVVNFGTTDAYYHLSTWVQTEDYAELEGMYFMSGTPRALDAKTSQTSAGNMVLTHDVNNDGATDIRDAWQIQKAVEGLVEGWDNEAFRYDLNGDGAVTADDVQEYLNALVGLETVADLTDEVLKVEAGTTVSVSVSVELDDADKTYFDTYYPNGGYVEGYAVLTARNAGGVDLSLPYLGFYGNWDDGDIIDDGYFWDYVYADETDVVGNQYINVLWTQFQGMASAYYPGVNVYVEEDSVDLNHISISPNSDGYFDSVDDIYISMLRNARYMTFRYLDMDTGEVYYDQTVEYVSKSAYHTGYGQIIPTIYSWFGGEIPLYDFTDANGDPLPNNTHLLLQVEAFGDFEDAQAHSWGVPFTVTNQGVAEEKWGIPVSIDLEAPQLLSLEKTTHADGTVTLDMTFRDNLSVSAVGLMNSNGEEIYDLVPVADTEPDREGYQNYTLSFDITERTGKLLIMLSDYALNEQYYALNLGGEGAPYGELVAYQYDIINETNGWVSFDEGVDSNEVQITIDQMDFVCAEYVNGYIYAQTETGDLYGFRYSDLLSDSFDIEGSFITTMEFVYSDFAYSYTDGQLYGIYTWYDGEYPYTTINSINIHGPYIDEETGKSFGLWEEYWAFQRGGLAALCMAIDQEGTVYLLGNNENETAELWRSFEDDSYGMLFEKVADIDVPMDYLQSMTWDHNNGKLYWAQFYPTALFEYQTGLYTIDVTTGAYEQVGTLGGETACLFAPLSEETVASNEIYQNVPHTDASVPGMPVMHDAVVNLNLGATQILLYDVDPWYSDYKEMIWSSSDETVATVDEDGIVSAVGTGTCVITIANAADPAKFDTCTVNVSALSLTIQGLITSQAPSIGVTAGTNMYKYELLQGIADFETSFPITASGDFEGFGLDIATSVFARDHIWACEFGNTGMIYKIDPANGEVVDMLMPIDGDMLFGLTYNENLDTFTGIMNMYLYVDLALTHEESELIMDSYNEELRQFDYHRINMLEYLLAAGGNFVTNETGQGASSEIVMCGITTITDPYTYTNTNQDFLGEYCSNDVDYTSTQTLVVLDNVGRLWYIDEICGMTKSGSYFKDANSKISSRRNGVIAMEAGQNDEGKTTYNVFYIRAMEETPLTDMFRDGTLPRITYHFSDIEFGGYTADGAPMFALSLYDYWNNGTTNELYLYIPETANSDEKCYYLGTTGQYNIIASIHDFELIGGLDD